MSQRYWAFISYSWKDKGVVAALHRRLERFPLPRPIRKQVAPRWGLSGARLRPIFRDDEEMSTAGVLDDRLREAIDSSTAMVLLASPNAANSRYVNDEVAHFVATRGLERLIVIAIGGSQDQPPAWPPVLRDRGSGLLWVDCRGGRQLDRRGLVRVVAAILGVDFDQLWRRNRRRRRRIGGGVAAGSAALIAAFGLMFAQQQSTERLSPERQRVVFEAHLQEELLARNKQFDPHITAGDLQYKILRSDDLNRDGLLDYVVSNQTPAFCGSGGCGFDVYLTDAPGSYTPALELLGASTPQVRGREGDTAEVVITDHYVSQQPLYSVYRISGKTYKLSHYEFCDGVAFEMCEPTVISLIDSPNGLKVAPGTTVLQRPKTGARPATVGAGDMDADAAAFDPTVLGMVSDEDWYLVEIWKGSTRFVPAQSVT